MSPNEILREIAATYPTLDRWRQRAAEVIRPSIDSELHRQDLEWPYVPSSQIALAGLAAAREHLHAVRLLVAAGELFPAATATLARAGLEGAAQTVWTLAPDDHAERMRRSLSVVREDYRHHRNYGLSAADANTVEATPTAGEQMTRLNARLKEVTALADQYGGATKINMTDDVLPAAVKATAHEEEFHEHVQLRHRQMAGSAHSLLWPHFGYADTRAHSVDPVGISEMSDGGDFDRLGMDYFSAYHVASRGWRLFAQRAGREDLAS